MAPLLGPVDVPDSNSPDLVLAYQTAEECIEIWTNVSAPRKDSLTVPAFLEESKYLTNVPLAKHGGMTTWVLIDKILPPNQRTILCSCESFIKHAIISDAKGNIEDRIVHGIASVFCPKEYRRRGYGARHMKEIAKPLYKWKLDHGKCVGSILYSDIGKAYYAKLGWLPAPNNSHLVFPPAQVSTAIIATEVAESDLAKLCQRDEAIVRKAMTTPTNEKWRVTIVPDLDHMLWHISKEQFATEYLFGRTPRAKGAIAGSPGSQVWVIWTHRYYRNPDWESPHNVLYILRLVIEGDESREKPALAETASKSNPKEPLKAVIRAAQAEAAEWRLNYVKLWDPTPLALEMIVQSGIKHHVIEREEDSIASGLWYDAHQRGSIMNTIRGAEAGRTMVLLCNMTWQRGTYARQPLDAIQKRRIGNHRLNRKQPAGRRTTTSNLPIPARLGEFTTSSFQYVIRKTHAD